MRNVPVGITNLLKSKSMLGNDAPVGWIEFPSLKASPQEKTWLPADTRQYGVISQFETISPGNWVQTADGRQLGCYQKQETSGNPKVYLSWLDSEDTIFNQNNAFLTGAQVFLTKVSPHMSGDPVRLLKKADGRILLFIVEPGQDSALACHIDVYESANGNGTDFVKIGEVYRNDNRANYTGSMNGTQFLGQPIQLQSGRIILPFASQEDWDLGTTYGRCFCGVGYSDDGGITWSFVKYFRNNYCNGGGARGIAKFGNRLVTAGTHSYGSGYFEFFYSDDEGTTWQALGISSTPWLYRAVFWGGEADDVNYLLYAVDNSTKAYRLYKSTSSTFSLDETVYNTGAIGSGNLWEGAYETIGLFGDGGETIFVNQDTGCLGIIGYRTSSYGTLLNGVQRTLSVYKLQVSNISVQREEAADSQRMTFSLPNVNPDDPTDFGYYMPYRSTEFGKTKNAWYCVLVPSQKVVAKMGYGDNIATVFTGEIDEVQCSANPRDYVINVDCRDLACWLIDKQIKLVFNGETEYYIEYPLPAGVTKYWLDPGAIDIPDIADIVKDLCMRAGFAADDILVEQTGIQLDPMWEKMSYMDCINDLCTAAGFEFFVDEDGKANFYRQSDREPNVSGQSVILTGTDWADLGHVSIVSGSDVVKSNDELTTYSRTTDYEIDLINGKIRRRTGGTIADGATVKVSFVFAGHIYKEGEDIYGLNLTISRRNIYGSIRVAGDGEEVTSIVSSPLWDGSRIDADKVLFADNQYLDTLEKTQKCADRLKGDMLNRYICTDFVCVAHPWLQVGDCVQVVESSTTISEIYKIMSISFDLTQDGFVSSIKAFHVGYTPIS